MCNGLGTTCGVIVTAFLLCGFYTLGAGPAQAMGRKEGGRGEGAKQRNTSAALDCLEGAEDLQQAAERKQAEAAIPGLQQAAATFKEAIALSQEAAPALPPDRHWDAYFGLAETLQRLAECILDACASLPDEQLSPAVYADARRNAKVLCRQAVDAYQKVRTPQGQVRVDACVNAANTLAAWADMEQGDGQPGRAGELLSTAVEGYRRALEQEEDAATWSNLADTLVKRGEVLAEGGAPGDASPGAAYGEAMRAYERACQLSASEAGDDLPGLLHNWGVGLHSLGTHAQDHGSAMSALDEAVKRLGEAAAFGRGDPQPLNALGDALAARAERVSNPAEALDALNAALERGYCAALRLSARDADALVGVAEVHASLGRLKAAAAAANHSPNGEASKHFSEALRCYAVALAAPATLGDLRERCDVRYNYACTLARALACGALPQQQQPAAQQQICGLLQRVLAAGCTSAAQIAGDADLESVRGMEWFAALTQPAPAAVAGEEGSEAVMPCEE